MARHFEFTSHALERYRERVGEGDPESEVIAAKPAIGKKAKQIRAGCPAHQVEGTKTTEGSKWLFWTYEKEEVGEVVFVTKIESAGHYTVVTCLTLPPPTKED